jgi:hypothetical protein
MLDPGFDCIFGRADARIAVLEELPVGVNADGQQTWTSFLGFTYVSYHRDPLISDPDPPAQAA